MTVKDDSRRTKRADRQSGDRRIQPRGAHWNVLIASTPEGDDKPYKY